MNSLYSKLIIILFISLLSGCATNIYPGGPTPSGVIFTSTTSTASQLSLPTDENASQHKVGKASASAIFGLFGFGNSSVTEAMQDGNIKKVHHVDYKNTSLLFGLFLSTTTIVYGE